MKKSNESTSAVNEAPEQQWPSGYQAGPWAIVWMCTMTQQEDVEAEVIPAPGKVSSRTGCMDTNRWLNCLLKALSVHLWIILFISKKVSQCSG